MNNFVSRGREFKQLQTIYEQEKKGSLVILYGRRRLGKTTLLKQFCRTIPHCYFMAGRAGEESIKMSLSIAMATALNEPFLQAVNYPLLVRAFCRL